MTVRVRDLRVRQAQESGIIVGLPRAFAATTALVADLLVGTHIWSDAMLMFADIGRHQGATWKVPITEGWWMLFDWMDGIGAVELRMHNDDYD